MEGTAENFGTELAQDVDYIFTGIKSAIFSYHGCTLEVKRNNKEKEKERNLVQPTQNKPFILGFRNISQLHRRRDANDILFKSSNTIRRKTNTSSK